MPSSEITPAGLPSIMIAQPVLVLASRAATMRSRNVRVSPGSGCGSQLIIFETSGSDAYWNSASASPSSSGRSSSRGVSITSGRSDTFGIPGRGGAEAMPHHNRARPGAHFFTAR
jgi:hypothetical protein